MITFIGVAEKNTVVQAPRVVACAAGVATLAFPDQRYVQSQTIARRYIQNVGAQRVYLSFGVDGGAAGRPDIVQNPVPSCDNINNFHGFIEAGQTYDCSLSLQMVSVYSPAGSTIATVLVVRN